MDNVEYMIYIKHIIDRI